jgi:hypothetical protein
MEMFKAIIYVDEVLSPAYAGSCAIAYDIIIMPSNQELTIFKYHIALYGKFESSRLADQQLNNILEPESFYEVLGMAEDYLYGSGNHLLILDYKEI